MRSKKGAVELSMSTIIIIILGVTLLSLGLILVKGTFSSITRTTQGALDKGDVLIGEIFEDVDSPLVISPPKTTVPQGVTDAVDVIVSNQEQESIQITAKTKSLDPDFLECSFSDTKKDVSRSYTLTSGKQAKFGLIVSVKSNAQIGKLLVCDVEVTGLTGDTSEQLSVIVGKEKGLF